MVPAHSALLHVAPRRVGFAELPVPAIESLTQGDFVAVQMTGIWRALPVRSESLLAV
jgi:hypothetical protein